MPLYDYTCSAIRCNHRFEAIRSIKESSTVVIPCPKCGASAARDEVPQLTHSSKDGNARGSSLGIRFFGSSI
jgi:putative FmdB family regulatory protein